MKTLLILVYFGEMKWLDEYMKNITPLKEYGYDWLIFRDKEKYTELIKQKLGIVCDWSGIPVKPCDYAPAYGIIFEDYLKGYDWWGYTNFDLVYGRLDKFITEEMLNTYDVISTDNVALNGALSMFRNNKYINNLFKKKDGWVRLMSDKKYHNFDEYGFNKNHYETGGFNGIVCQERFRGRLKSKYEWLQCHDGMANHNPPKLSIGEDGSLICGDCRKEIATFHFNRSRPKIYPKIQ
jgi:hypothetical protein